MSLHHDKYYTSLDEDLKNLATMDWATFAMIVGEEAIISAKICLLRRRGHSLQQIANRLDISKQTVRYWVEKQPERISCKK